jgi:hypothetical protein
VRRREEGKKSEQDQNPREEERWVSCQMHFQFYTCSGKIGFIISWFFTMVKFLP